MREKYFLSPILSDEEFEFFHKKFLSDPTFQIARIRFPLKGIQLDSDNVGLDENGNEITGEYIWTRDTWNILHELSKVDSSDFNFETKRGINLVIKKINGKGFGIATEEKYQCINGKWYLIYYKSIDL